MKFFISGLFALAFVPWIWVHGVHPSSLAGEHKKMRLVWSDEFSQPGKPDTTKWGYDYGDGCLEPSGCGWGNNELQYYTSRSENARIQNGFLIIEARRENMGKFKYSSARLVTRHKGDWTYGRIDVRAILPNGVGVWPAIWMLPTDFAYGSWPASGEIDIMEHVGFNPDSIFSTLHTNQSNGMFGNQVTKGASSKSLSTDFHEYSMEWDEDKMEFFFDGNKYYTFRNLKAGPDSWPFDQPFHLILNVTVGGNWGGKMGVDETIWPQKMVVDYVRVYQK